MDGAGQVERGLDGRAVEKLLGGAVLKGRDPLVILKDAAIDPALYGNAGRSIDGPALVRLVRAIQLSLDDVYLGFLPHGIRLALETERLLSFLHCSTFGEALRVSIRFTDADDCVDRDILVWIRFVWIYHLFSWLIGRPLVLRGLSIQGASCSGERPRSLCALQLPCDVQRSPRCASS